MSALLLGNSRQPDKPPAPHPRAEQVAREFHAEYEALVPLFGYKTRGESAVPWTEVPSADRALMVATATRLLERGVVR